MYGTLICFRSAGARGVRRCWVGRSCRRELVTGRCPDLRQVGLRGIAKKVARGLFLWPCPLFSSAFFPKRDRSILCRRATALPNSIENVPVMVSSRHIHNLCCICRSVKLSGDPRGITVRVRLQARSISPPGIRRHPATIARAIWSGSMSFKLSVTSTKLGSQTA